MEWTPNKQTRHVLLIIACLAMAAEAGLVIAANDQSNKVKIVSAGVELVGISPSAEQCASKKGQTVRLKIVSQSSVDVRLYIKTGYKQWVPKDFPNQQSGSEIVDYRCEQKPDYKVYAHAAGSSDAWPKP
jgi:predicted ATP-grasp superfamily ATP-dependent carboligase